MLDNFRTRDRVHEAALDRVVEAFGHYGLRAERYGTETDRQELRAMMAESWNDVAIRMRYRPDLAILIPGYGAAHCEVKSAQPEYQDFVIEVKAAWAAREHGRDDPWAMYAFVVMPTGPILACHTSEMRLPAQVNLPERWDNLENRDWIARHFRGAWFKPERWANGAGTPYFRVPRRDPCFMLLEPFIRERLLRQIPADEPRKMQSDLGLDYGD